MPAGCKVLDPRSFVAIKPLPFPPAQGLKVQARSLTVYRPCEPSREQVFRENYRRRQKQLRQQGYRSVIWKPYEAIGQPLRLGHTEFILYSLGQLDQTMIDETISSMEERPEEPKHSSSTTVPKENKMPAENRIHLKHRDKDLKTISKDLLHTRQLVKTAKQGQGFFKRLKREEKEKETAQLREQRNLIEKRKTAWQPPKFSSDEDSEEEQDVEKRFFKTEPVLSAHLKTVQHHSQKASRKGKNVTARPYTPVHCSLISTRFTEKDLEPLHRQLCALNWLLEAVAADPPSTIGPVSSCWSTRDSGGMKNVSRKISKDKSIEYKWEQFISQSKFKRSTLRVLQKTPMRPRRASLSVASPANVSSSVMTPVFDSTASEVTISEDVGAGTPAAVLESLSEIPDDDSTISSLCTQNKQEQEEEPISDYLQKLLDSVHQSINTELHGEQKDPRNNEQSSTAVMSNGKMNPRASHSTEPPADVNKLQQRPKSSPSSPISKSSLFSASRSSLPLEMQSKFIEITKEAALCLHDNLEALEKNRWDTSKRKFCALENISSFYTFSEDLQRSLQESRGNKTEGTTETWYSSLLSSVPEAVQRNQKISRALRRLEKFGVRQNFRIWPQHFLKVLHGLRNWELCSPDVSAAVEFMRDKVIQMPMEDYDSWLQLKLKTPQRIQSAPPMR
ncbi:coiled-coil domain-containing protein 60-like isoform X1 [Mobula birostris]|uniref:coiled-coil domain-containing protein 60-like isoform X1 n=1 Tax=Mobula birostris TaxID=1983395 RepID=UPI003B28A592